MFSDAFGRSVRSGYVIGTGDVIEVSIWEAPPAMLFGGAVADPRSAPATTHATTFPDQMVSSDGTIKFPFAGQIASAGKTP